ncbi:MAG: hypothetical protein HQ559_04975 [Lentisphaerae bacterium]|nr:hypothetical protein [Lentisphaerota bacterium]
MAHNGIADKLLELFGRWQSADLVGAPDPDVLGRYTRQHQAAQLDRLLRDVLAEKEQ